MKTNFDINGSPVDKTINAGDRVLYSDSRTRGGQTVKYVLIGTWDGEKVQFNDKDNTLVRNKAWLTKIN